MEKYRKYEIMYILASTLDEEARKNEISKLHGILEAGGGKVTDVKEMGEKAFAYPIKKMSKGYYIVIKVGTDIASLEEFKRIAKLDQNVVRYLVLTDKGE